MTLALEPTDVVLPVAARSRSHLSRQRIRAAWLFLLPMLIILAAVAGWPLIRTIYFSFTNARDVAGDAVCHSRRG